MPRARVLSLDALTDLRAALLAFVGEAQESLTASEEEIRRNFDWLADQKAYWQRQIRDRYEEVVRAKTELAMRKMVPAGQRVPDTTEQEKALRRALARLAEAEDKLELCVGWLPKLRRETEEYQGPAHKLAHHAEGELPRAIALLEWMIAHLQEYVATPAGPHGVGSAPPSVARPMADRERRGPGQSMRDRVSLPETGIPASDHTVPLAELIHIPALMSPPGPGGFVG